MIERDDRDGENSEDARPGSPSDPTPGRPLSGHAIVGALADSVVVASREYARRLRLIADLHRHRDMQPPAVQAGRTPGEIWSRSELTTAEIQGPLRVDASTAALLVRRALALTGRLPRTLDLLSAGRLDEARANAVTDFLAPVLDAAYEAQLRQHGSPRRAEQAVRELADQFEARLLDRAPAQPLDRLKAAIQRAITRLAADYQEARRRARVAGRDVFVSRRGQEPGMAFLGARLPAVEAHACLNELDTCARRLRHSGDPRPLDALRADLLVARVLHQPDPRRADDALLVAVRPAAVDADADSESPADADGHAHAESRTPGHVVARGVKTHIQITISLATLMGLDDHDAELSGYGPISARVARDAAMQAGSVWRRLVIDPYDGKLIDFGRRTYRPPVALADKVVARDVTCAHPGCPRPAELCDLDHIVPYPLGTTGESNLRARCRWHHRLKHQAGWEVRESTDPADPPGTLITTSRTGHEYKTYFADLRPDDRAPPPGEADPADGATPPDQVPPPDDGGSTDAGAPEEDPPF